MRLYKATVKVASKVDAAGPKHPAAQQFIERLMRIANTESVPEFAAQTGQPERYVYRWRAGAAAPNFINTVEMLERLGLLRWTDEPSQLSSAQERRRLKLLAETQQAIERLLEEMGQ